MITLFGTGVNALIIVCYSIFFWVHISESFDFLENVEFLLKIAKRYCSNDTHYTNLIEI